MPLQKETVIGIVVGAANILAACPIVKLTHTLAGSCVMNTGN